MALNEQQIKSLTAIYKFAYNNPDTHRNTMRKSLLNKGKIPTKEVFAHELESLLALGTLTQDKENISLNPQIMQVGLMQKSGNDCFVVTPGSNKKLHIDRSVAAGYNSGELVDMIVVGNGKNSQVIVLGRSQKQAEKESKKHEHIEHPAITLENSAIAAQDSNMLLGRVVKLSHDNLVFIPNKKSLPTRQIHILNSKEEYASFQDKLCIMRLEDPEAPLLGGTIVSIKGDAGNPIHEYDAIAESYGAIMNWNDAKDEIAKIPKTVETTGLNLISEEQAIQNGQRGKVVDLRHIPFVTVDPATCKDMDDAIYSTYDENGDTVIYTAVANVTKYVNLDSIIGHKYVNGGFTIYAPNKAYSILPSELSTGICSLNPNEDRLSFVVKGVIDKSTGEVKEGHIFDAIIQSRQKYAYEEPQAMIDTIGVDDARQYIKDKVKFEGSLSLEEQAFMNYYAAETIKSGWQRRQMLRFNSNRERDIIFDEGLADVVDIKPVPHLAYHEVIEAFMITANEITAKYAKDNGIDNVYRVHEQPNPRKLNRAGEFFSLLGIDFDGDLSAQNIRDLLQIVRGNANEEDINAFLIKMQSRAKYSDRLISKKVEERLPNEPEDEISHFALQSKHYSHTTSPIRRIVDYATQYNILAHIHGTKPLSADRVAEIIDIANQRQLDIDQAEKDFDDISSVLYCEKHIGDQMHGRISKIRYASAEENLNDTIVVIAKDDERGISVEIPLSQVIGKRSDDFTISEQGCAVFDAKGNVLLSICKPIDFIIESASRKTMTVTAKTNKAMIHEAESRSSYIKQYPGKNPNRKRAYNHHKDKHSRANRFANNMKHKDDDGWGMD